MKNFLFSSAFIFTCIFNLSAQEHESSHESEHSADRPIIEIITSAIYAYSLEHEEGALGTEIHLTYWINHKWGFGGSYTAKFEESEVYSDIALIGSYNPFTWMTVNAGPNFALEKEGREFELGAYLEAEFNYRPAEWVHFGPVLGTVMSKNTELTAGIHVGFEF